MQTEPNEVETYVHETFPANLDAIVDYIEQLEDAGQVKTLDDLKARFTDLAQLCREYGK